LPVVLPEAEMKVGEMSEFHGLKSKGRPPICKR
jgi:hypothetical protein